MPDSGEAVIPAWSANAITSASTTMRISGAGLFFLASKASPRQAPRAREGCLRR